MKKCMLILLLVFITGCNTNVVNESIKSKDVSENTIEETETDIIEIQETVESTKENLNTPHNTIIEYVTSNTSILEPFYLADIDSDNQVEIISTLSGGESNAVCATVYDYNDDLEQVVEVGYLNLDGMQDVHKLTCYVDSKTKESFLYNIVSEISPYSDCYQVSEYRYDIMDGKLITECMSINSVISKTDKSMLEKYLNDLNVKMSAYEMAYEIVIEQRIGSMEIWNGSYVNIVRNFCNQNPNVIINVNEKAEELPWNTYQYVIEENFDWLELNQLPNLRNLVINMNDEPSKADYLSELKSVKSIKFEQQSWRQEDFDELSKMDFLEELYLDKCIDIDMAFLKRMDNLKFLSISYDNVEKALKYLEGYSLKRIELHRCTRQQYGEIIKKYPQYSITMVDDLDMY